MTALGWAERCAASGSIRPRKWIQTLREPLLPEAVAEATEPTAAAVTTAAANKESIAIRLPLLACSSSVSMLFRLGCPNRTT
jgi:hypothetical protein